MKRLTSKFEEGTAAETYGRFPDSSILLYTKKCHLCSNPEELYSCENSISRGKRNVQCKFVHFTRDIRERWEAEMIREELFSYVKEEYVQEPDYPWENDYESAVLRHSDTGKWFALVM